MASLPNPMPINPGRIHQALTSYQLAMALKGAIELDVFTHIAAGATTSDAIAPLCQGTEKGVRVLCDYLTVHGFLTKSNGSLWACARHRRAARQEFAFLHGIRRRVLHASGDDEQVP